MKVSVALTSSKSEQFLRQQLDSIINQTYKNFEICISHDECGDNTIEIIKKYSQKDPRIRWEYNRQQKGLLGNTQNSIDMCRGKIIFLCDHDDIWTPDRIQEHVNIYKNNLDISWVYNDSILIDTDNNQVGKLQDKIPEYFTKKRLRLLNFTWGSCIGGAHCSFLSTELKKCIPFPPFIMSHDSWIDLFLYPKKGFFIDKELLKYRIHSQNLSAWNKKYSHEEILTRENEAIKNNLMYLRELALCKQLSGEKRLFFLFVYIAKIVRGKLRSFFS